jgi:type I restriction enzyme S subunit
MSDDVMEMLQRTFPKSVQPGLPKLKPPKPGWKSYRFGELLEQIQRRLHLQPDETYDLVTVKRSRGGIESRGRLRGSQISVTSQFRIAEGDFLISKRQIVHGACGVVSSEFDGAVVSNEYSVLRCKPNIDLAFLQYLSHSVYFQQTCFHSSIGVHIEKMIFKLDEWFKWPVNIPALPEQQKIAAFLGAVDAKLAALTAKQAALVRFKAGLMQKLFSQQLRFARDDGQGFPDWEEKRLGDIVDYEQPTKYLVSSTDYSDDFTTPVLTAGKTLILGYTDETHGIYNGPLPVIIFDDFTTASKFVDFPFKAKSSAMKILRPRSDDVKIKLVFEFLQMMNFSPDSHQRHWISRFSEIQVLFPCPDEQQKIADALSAIDTKTQAVTDQVTRLQTFKKGLLQQMFV